MTQAKCNVRSTSSMIKRVCQASPIIWPLTAKARYREVSCHSEARPGESVQSCAVWKWTPWSTSLFGNKNSCLSTCKIKAVKLKRSRLLYNRCSERKKSRTKQSSKRYTRIKPINHQSLVPVLFIR